MFQFIAAFALIAIASAAPGFVTETHHALVQPTLLAKTAVVDTSASSAITHQSFTNLEKKVPLVQAYAAAAPVVHTYQAHPVVKAVSAVQAAPVVHSYSAVPVVQTVAAAPAPVVHTYATAPVVKAAAPLVHTYSAAPVVPAVAAAPILQSYANAPVVHSVPVVQSAPIVKTVVTAPVAYHSYH